MNKDIHIQIPSLFPTLLQVLFIALKLTGHIDWSWFWVLSPLWMSIAIVILIFIIFVPIFFGGSIIDTIRRRK